MWVFTETVTFNYPSNNSLQFLLFFVAVQEQERLQVDVEKKLDVEMDWLHNIEIEEHSGEEMQMLLAGHLKLVTALFSCEGIDKRKYGQCSAIATVRSVFIVVVIYFGSDVFSDLVQCQTK